MFEFGGVKVGDGAADGWAVGGGEDEFEAVFENEGIEEGGVGFAQVVAQGGEVFEGQGALEGFATELVEKGLDGVAVDEAIELAVDLFFEVEEFLEALVLLGGQGGLGFELAELGEFLADLDGAGLELLVAIEDFLFRFEDDEVVAVAAAGVAEVVFEFLDFEEVEDLLSFEDAILLEEEVGKISVSAFNREKAS